MLEAGGDTGNIEGIKFTVTRPIPLVDTHAVPEGFLELRDLALSAHTFGPVANTP
jgi:hypothetical protein